MNTRKLQETAHALVDAGKGILAIDESFPTIAKRFASIGLESSEQHRRDYRELLVRAPGVERYVSGMIFFDETLRQKSAAGRLFPELLRERGILPGIKVDLGARPLAGHPHETVTEGLDGLRERLREYRELGACFAKWRAVIRIQAEQGLPSAACLEANAQALARYAALCQEAGLVPIVEPEVLMDGAHDLAGCYQVTVRTLRAVFEALAVQQVFLEGVLLKSSMVLDGADLQQRAGVPQRAGVREVAEQTLRCLRESVPEAVPGVVFLSGGQSARLATEHLNAMSLCTAEQRLPWTLSFSYGRALQEPCLRTWGGDAARREAAQQALLHRARCNSLACLGRYSPELEEAA